MWERTGYTKEVTAGEVHKLHVLNRQLKKSVNEVRSHCLKRKHVSQESQSYAQRGKVSRMTCKTRRDAEKSEQEYHGELFVKGTGWRFGYIKGV